MNKQQPTVRSRKNGGQNGVTTATQVCLRLEAKKQKKKNKKNKKK